MVGCAAAVVEENGEEKEDTDEEEEGEKRVPVVLMEDGEGTVAFFAFSIDAALTGRKKRPNMQRTTSDERMKFKSTETNENNRK